MTLEQQITALAAVIGGDIKLILERLTALESGSSVPANAVTFKGDPLVFKDGYVTFK